MTFPFDTSGSVSYRVHGLMQTKVWPDLSPFVQGCVEALLTEWNRGSPNTVDDLKSHGFSDVAPETLARIMEDCERYVEATDALHGSAAAGGLFWRERQRGDHDDFPPLTPYLGDDGKVYLRESGQ